MSADQPVICAASPDDAYADAYAANATNVATYVYAACRAYHAHYDWRHGNEGNERYRRNVCPDRF